MIGNFFFLSFFNPSKSQSYYAASFYNWWILSLGHLKFISDSAFKFSLGHLKFISDSALINLDSIRSI